MVSKFVQCSVIIIITVLVVLLCSINYLNEKTFIITIKDKYIKNYNDSITYLVVDTDNNTYEITDLFFKFKYNSTDIYNNLDVGNTYEVTTTGFRIRFFSSYPNINKIQLLEEQE